MASIRVSVVIHAPPRVVWRHIEDIESHVRWMEDAHSITVTSGRRRGVGTTFDCDTRVGPFRLLDRMEITRWRPRRSMGVRHVGVVSGEGRFSLRGGLVGAPVLRVIWRRNLRNLKRLVEG
jgi:hypothetical protein